MRSFARVPCGMLLYLMHVDGLGLKDKRGGCVVSCVSQMRGRRSFIHCSLPLPWHSGKFRWYELYLLFHAKKQSFFHYYFHIGKAASQFQRLPICLTFLYFSHLILGTKRNYVQGTKPPKQFF